MRDGTLAFAALTERIIGCAIKVHKDTGAGLLESVYKACLIVELRGSGLQIDTECNLPLFDREVQLEVGFRADIIVEKAVVVRSSLSRNSWRFIKRS
jgi:GxxExxY protein